MIARFSPRATSKLRPAMTALSPKLTLSLCTESTDASFAVVMGPQSINQTSSSRREPVSAAQEADPGLRLELQHCTQSRCSQAGSGHSQGPMVKELIFASKEGGFTRP